MSPAAPAAEPAPAALRQRLTVRTRRVPGVPVVALRLAFTGGARAETSPGLGLLTGRMLAEGTARRGWRQLAEDVEARGMNLATSGTYEATAVALDALASDWELALAWAAEIALEPAFPADRLEWLARQIAAEIESLGDQPEVRTAWSFLEQLYRPHPRGRRLQGDAASLAAATPEDCRRLHGASLGRGIYLSVSGEIDEEAVTRRAEELFADLAARPAVAPVAPPAPEGGPPRVEVTVRGSDQAHLYLGHLTVPRRDPDFTALELAAVVLGAGSGLTGRIPQRIREREGLAYTAYAQVVAGAGLDPGRLVAYVGTSPATVSQAERGVREEIARFVTEGVTEAELAEARSYLLGREPFRRETARQWAELMIESAFYGLPLDDHTWREAQLQAPDRAAVEAAVRRHLDPERLKVTVGSPPAAS